MARNYDTNHETTAADGDFVDGSDPARTIELEAHPYLTGIHEPMLEEVLIEHLPVEGAIPPDLDGIYLRIGPNPVGTPDPAAYHWFAGDGMVHGVRITAGKALWYRNRWIRTSDVSEALGEAMKPGPRLIETTVNTNVIHHGGRTYALVEGGGTPIEISDTLDTVAHDAFDGTLLGAFSAHPHRDPASGELHAICYNASDLDRVHHVVVGADGNVRREEPVAVQHGPSIHDCAITQRFVLVFDLPVTFSEEAKLAGYLFPYRWNADHAARVGLLAREGAGEDIVWCDVDPCYVYHPCNAYDAADGNVVVDVVVHDRNSHRDFRGPDPDHVAFERWTIDPSNRQVKRYTLDNEPQEFPRFDERRTGKSYRYAYSVRISDRTNNLVGDTRILKHDLDTGSREVRDFGKDRHPGEFVFIPRDRGTAEDDGYLMGYVINLPAETTELVILDARNFRWPALASIGIPHRVPPGFHGNWVPVIC